MIKKFKVNNFKLKEIKQEKQFDQRPFILQDIFKIKFPTLFIFSKKNSGKTYFVCNLIQQLIIPQYSSVFIFSQSIDNDSTLQPFLKILDNKGIYNEKYYQIQNGTKRQPINNLQNSLDKLKEFNEKKQQLQQQYIEQKKLTQQEQIQLKQKKQWIKKKQFQNPGEFQCYNIVYFDDLIQEDLKNKTLQNLWRTSRHHNVFLILSSQSYKNLYSSQFRSQVSHIIFFKGQPDQLLKDMIDEYGLLIDFDQLKKIYIDATTQKYSFLMIDTYNSKFYKNLNEQYITK